MCGNVSTLPMCLIVVKIEKKDDLKEILMNVFSWQLLKDQNVYA